MSMRKKVWSLLFFMVTVSSLAWGTGYYVDDTAMGLNDGSSWSNAFTDLQSALALVTSNDEIHVAAGIYKATMGSDRQISFSVPDGVALYGSYPDGGGEYDRRDTALHSSVLSGDIGVASDSSDNTCRIVDFTDCSDATILDGFVIRDGQADMTGIATSGGGIFMYPGSPVIRNTIVEDNYASNRGGGLLARDSSPVLINVVFRENTAGVEGGGVCNRASSSRFYNVIFDENTAVNGNGGGVYSYGETSTPMLINSAFHANSASGNGEAIFSGNGALTGANCIVWGNIGGTDPVAYNSGSVSLSYSNVEGGYVGAGNVNIDPEFIDALNGDFRLAPDSPMIDQGSNALLPSDATDLDGDGDTSELIPCDAGMNSRNADCPWLPPQYDAQKLPLVDIGPCEYAVVYVDASATGANTGYSWEDAYTNLTTAITETTDTYGQVGIGMSIWVAAGTYKPTDDGDRTRSFSVRGCLSFYGGFAGTESAVGQRDWVTNRTILSGDIGTPGDTSDNSYCVFHTWAGWDSDLTVLDGFRITGGNADGSWPNYHGAGVRSEDCTLYLRHMDIRENRAKAGGGGVSADTCELYLNDVEFEDNVVFSPSGDGGGLQIMFSPAPVLGERVLFSRNVAGRIGGGLTAGECSIELRDSSFINNVASSSGGGINISSSYGTTTLERVVFDGNIGGLGGGMQCLSAFMSLRDASFVRNTATNYFGGGLDCRSPGVISNVWFHGNRATGESHGNGGGLALMYVSGTCSVVNAEFVGNFAAEDGGAMYCSSFLNHLICDNVTAVSNLAGNGSGVYTYSSGETTIRNSILRNNGMIESGPYDGKATITYTDITGGHTGTNNIDAIPLFVRNPHPGADGQWGTGDDDYGDLRLQLGSPCIDAGGNPLIPSRLDLAGVYRPFDGDADSVATIDIGCYETYNPAGDTDGDTMTDEWEDRHGFDMFYAADALLNPDKDPYVNADEHTLDYNPLVGNDWFCITAVSNNSPFTIFFDSSVNRNYTLLGCSNLTEGAWQPLVGPRAGVGGADSMTDESSSPSNFYKVLVELP